MSLDQTVQRGATQPASVGRRPGLSGRRLTLVAVVSGVCFAAGFYLGVYALFALAGLSDLHGWLFLVVTVPLGGLLAGLGAAAAGPSTRTLLGPAVASSFLTALVVTAGLVVFDADFALAISIGGILSLAAATVTVAATARNRRLAI
jgi:hypothetical protein